MHCYELNGKILVSDRPYTGLKQVSEDYAKQSQSIIYLLTSIDPEKSRLSFCVSDASAAFLKSEGLELLRKGSSHRDDIPDWLESRINYGKVMSINTGYKGWQERLDKKVPEKWRINICGLGDVGSTLATGLRLLGGDHVSSLGLYDRDDNKVKRWVYETGQIFAPWSGPYPDVFALQIDDMFDCDMFVFCVSAGVPPVGSKMDDVRMAQFESNSKIVEEYAKTAAESGFKGIFAVVSDPVDLLCKAALVSSREGRGLMPEQIIGYGLGVMNARAVFYAKREQRLSHYVDEGRAFGPHGHGLIIADSIKNYNDELSCYLTEKARNANLDIRSTGYKPYIAPALSSGALSIVATIKGDWHYSATYMGGVYMGAKNRLTDAGTEVEMIDMPDKLWERLKSTYKYLRSII